MPKAKLGEAEEDGYLLRHDTNNLMLMNDSRGREKIV